MKNIINFTCTICNRYLGSVAGSENIEEAKRILDIYDGGVCCVCRKMGGGKIPLNDTLYILNSRRKRLNSKLDELVAIKGLSDEAVLKASKDLDDVIAEITILVNGGKI